MKIFRTTPIALIAGLVAALLLATPAGADKSFTFNGSGRGHGIGMPQYGAYGLARKGWKAPRIVRYFYNGVRVQKRPPPKGRYRVGLLQNRPVVTLTATAGRFILRLQDGTVIDRVPQGETRRVRITPGERYRVKDGKTTVGGHAWGGPANPLSVRRRGGGVVRVTQWGHSIGRGFLKFPIVGPRRGHLVAVVKPEPYLYGLGEVPSSWPQAVLQAQAIAARTYAFRVISGSSRAGCACDILGDVRDQNYTGWDKEAGTAGDRWVKAVNATDRKIALHKGEPISTFYSAASGGYTENVENVWGGTPQPYLKGKCDMGDNVSSNPYRTWSVTMSGSQIAAKLGKPNGMVRAIRIKVLERGVSGRIVDARIVGKKGNGTTVRTRHSGWDLRVALGLYESRFWVNQNRNVTGAIRRKYDAVRCRPGVPQTNQRKVKNGRWQGFQRGRIYQNLNRDRVIWLYGRVAAKYARIGAHTSRLGLPVRDIRRMKNGTVKGFFEGGVIRCPKGGACRVRYR